MATNDTLHGGGGNDTIEGGGGSDLISGGSGSDTFSGSIADLHDDTITDFSTGDRIVVSGADLRSLAGQSVSNSLTLGIGSSLTLQGTFAGKFWSAAYDSITGATTLQIDEPLRITAPSSLKARAGATLEVGGIVFSDPDSLATDVLKVTFTSDHPFQSLTVPAGVIATTPAVGASGTIELFGTLSQLSQAVIRYSVPEGENRTIPIEITLDDDDPVSSTAHAVVSVQIADDGPKPVDPNPSPVDPDSRPIYPMVMPNAGGGVDITITDPSQLTASLGTSGIDHVFYSGSGTVILPDTIENVTLTGGTAGVVGNALDNVLRGSIGDNFLQGQDGNDWIHSGAGNDRLEGGTGKDFIFGSAGNDLLEGGSGNDTLKGYTDNDRILGGAGNDLVYGNAGNDRVDGGVGRDLVHGGSGNDWVYGGSGTDTLKGGSGRDAFVFDTKPNKSNNSDRIIDFKAADDRIVLDNAVFTKLGQGSAQGVKIKADMFVIGTKAQDGQDRIIYDRDSGSLYYDRDGTGSAVQVKFAAISNKAKLTYHDFFVV